MPTITIGRSYSDLKKYGATLGTGFIGRHLVGDKREAHAANAVRMDVTRPHVIGVFGKRGSGKCLHGDTLIPLEDGSARPIKELAKSQEDIFGLNDEFKIEKMQKTEFFSRTVKEILKIRLRSGKEIKLTPEHPLFTIRGWRSAEDLPIGTRIGTPRTIPSFGKEEMPEHEIKFLAYLIAEGHLSNGFVLFSNKDQRIIDDFRRSVEDFDSNLRVEKHSKPSCYRVAQKIKEYRLEEIADGLGRNSTAGRYEQSSVRQWLERLGMCGKLSHDKFIPQKIMKLPKEQLALFLNRLFSCGCSLYKHKVAQGHIWKISFASVSEQPIRQVQHLLLRYNILSRIRKKKTLHAGKIFPSFELEIGPSGILKFIEEIGFFGQRMDQQLKAARGIENKVRNPNVDTVPKEIWEFYQPKNWAAVGSVVNYTTPQSLRESQRYAPSRQKLLQIAVADNAPNIKTLVESDIFWDEIVSIELIDGEFEVYDFSVPKHHNFIANDIIVHNSYTLAVITEELMNLTPEVRDNVSVIVIDTMGIYWSMKFPNDREVNLLDKWNLKPKALKTVHFIPEGQVRAFKENEIPFDKTFTLNPGELSSSDWSMAFKIKPEDEAGILLTRAMREVKSRKGNSYGIQDIIDAVKQMEGFDKRVQDVLENKFLTAMDWGVFSEKGMDMNELMKRGQSAVLDVSLFGEITGGWSVRTLLVGLLAKRILRERMRARRVEEIEEMEGAMKSEMPIVWMVLDEAHTFAPQVGETPASVPLQQWVKLGREPGVSLVVATQMPNKLHEDLIAQMDLVVSHRLTAKSDVDHLRNIMQTYMRYDLATLLDNLPRMPGAAICLDDNSERVYPIQVRPRFSWHGGGTPIAIKQIPKHIKEDGIDEIGEQNEED